jgi:hypothetical protein
MPTTSTLTRTEVPPVTAERVSECFKSAVFWADRLPRYANWMQRRADFWAVFAGIVTAVTGLAIWPVLGDSPSTTDKLIVSAGALLGALCALVPRVMNYGERAGAARELTSRYGAVLGRLEDLHHSDVAKFPDEARKAIAEFETIKTKKDELRQVGSRREIEARHM